MRDSRGFVQPCSIKIRMADFNPFSLEGKTILVTGASSGIGRGIAIACSKMGASVIANGRNEARLDDTFHQLQGDNNRMAIADLTVTEELTAMVTELPKLDGVVHCAGIGQRILCKQLQENDLEEVMNVNFKAPVMLQTELIKQKKINKAASIVFLASIASESPSAGNAIYSASKGAIISYAKCLAIELAPRLIRVNSIQPAMVWTNLIYKGGLSEDDLKQDEKKYPLKRYGTPEDIANLTIYLLSNASSWMTANSIKISGGL